ncbi:hypothetical protein HDE_02408 [Halotydeus destructor]|nr:hypothetical protein HDE_02408 [Halotydeus destructor]
MNVNLKSANSIYPCLDFYQVLIEQPSLGVTGLIRLLRIYVTQQPATSVKNLIYIREYKIPPSNLLNIECQLFAALYKYYCFVYVAINESTNAVKVRSVPVCKLTMIDHSGDPSTEGQGSSEDMESTLNHLPLAGPSLDVRGTSLHYGLSKKLYYQNKVQQGSETSRTIEVNCECTDDKYTTIPLAQINASVAIKLYISRCHGHDSDEDQRLDNGLNGRLVSAINPVNVCILNLTKGSSRLLRLESPFIALDSLASTLKLRDGPLKVDPLLRVVNGSIFHQLKSPFIRIEASRDAFLSLRLFEQFNDGRGKGGRERTTANKMRRTLARGREGEEEEGQLWFNLLSPLHYSALGFGAFTVAAILLYSCACLTSYRKRTIVVQISDIEDEITDNSYVAQSSVVPFEFADDVDSLEMDYYDYHATLLANNDDDDLSPDVNVEASD